MGRMVEGEWRTDWYKASSDGSFKRPATQFRDWVRKDGSTDFTPEAGRYHLYVAWACPWAHRTLVARKLLGLEDAIDVSIVKPFMGEDGWAFDTDDEEPKSTVDHINGHEFLRDVYKSAHDQYTGRVTVPVLWDRETGRIVNNESKEIIQMFDREFDELGDSNISLFPEGLDDEVDAAIERIYEPINNGVYRCGFATTQKAYERAATELFTELAYWEGILENQRYLCGDQFTAADICMFTTLFRFDIVYHTHFKCNLKQLRQYPNLWNFVKDVYQMPGVRETLDVDQTKRHYFQSHETVNPTRIVPIGPEIDFDEPHDRGRFA